MVVRWRKFCNGSGLSSVNLTSTTSVNGTCYMNDTKMKKSRIAQRSPCPNLSFHFRDALRADLGRKANHRGDEAPGNYRDLNVNGEDAMS